MKRKEVVSYLTFKYGEPERLNKKYLGSEPCLAYFLSLWKMVFVCQNKLIISDLSADSLSYEEIPFNKIKYIISEDGTQDRLCKITTLL